MARRTSLSSTQSTVPCSYTPIPVPPLEKSKFTEDPRGNLTEAEEDMYGQIVAHFSRVGYTLPHIEDGEPGGELSEKEKFWLSRDCLLRYLRASKWNTHVAAQKLESTLKWRREYGLYDSLTASSIEHEAVTGKHVLFGYDVEGRPALYAFPSRQNTDGVEGHLKFTFWMAERGIDLMGPGVESLHILLNFADRSSKPAYTEATTLIHILQEHYPERLGLCSIINIPFIINAFVKLMLPFLDPRTREKLRFNRSVVQDGLFGKDMLMKEWEGEQTFEYAHEKYWPALVEMCERNVERRMKRWRELGGRVGISEWEYKQEANGQTTIVNGLTNGSTPSDGKHTSPPPSPPKAISTTAAAAATSQ
ncbi:CRAL-TRIO domain-containing protein [Coprinopsis sp. MPI-PUGE-AT-0042]|nr:CRAL-TRIO domain-containing protein [Coprinopsis sp. MPI-PUGE-AT-0042]